MPKLGILTVIRKESRRSKTDQCKEMQADRLWSEALCVSYLSKLRSPAALLALEELRIIIIICDDYTRVQKFNAAHSISYPHFSATNSLNPCALRNAGFTLLTTPLHMLMHTRANISAIAG